MALTDNFRSNVREEMKRQRVGQQELARRTGLHYVTISRILTGTIEPKVETCEQIATALGVRPDTIFLSPVETGS